MKFEDIVKVTIGILLTTASAAGIVAALGIGYYLIFTKEESYWEKNRPSIYSAALSGFGREDLAQCVTDQLIRWSEDHKCQQVDNMSWRDSMKICIFFSQDTNSILEYTEPCREMANK